MTAFMAAKIGQAEIARRMAKSSVSTAKCHLLSCAKWRVNSPKDRRILDVCIGVRWISLFTVITLIVGYSIIRGAAHFRLRIVKFG
jgi:hypothetical protein